MRYLFSFLLLLLTLTQTLSAHEIKAVVIDYSGIRVAGEKEKILTWVKEEFESSKEELKNVLEEYKEELSQHPLWKKSIKKLKKYVPEKWQKKLAKQKERALVSILEISELARSLRDEGLKNTFLSRFFGDEGAYGPFSYGMSVENPSQEDYLALLEELGVAPEECFLVDDNEENVKIAQSVGIDAVHFEGLKQLKKELKKRDLKL
ncbi:MAG: hypothetical protein KR126chlam1_00157 [Chlamydiae bacterium]|nr:hypothetical protein [Chlamydiota bacterium]